MIEAEVSGKLGVGYRNATERGEDMLTSTVFGLLRYLPPRDALVAFLRRARPVTLSNDGIAISEQNDWLDWDLVHDGTVEFWPRFGQYGIPDILVSLHDASGATLAELVVEAKLYSPKSGSAGEEDEELAQDDVIDPDQLVRYAQGLDARETPGEHARGLIYLTSHAVPPADELRATLGREPSMCLAWLSWRDAWRVAHRMSGVSRPAADLARLLAYKRLRSFAGFTAPLPPSGTWTTSGRLWKASATYRGFTCTAPDLPPRGRFWRDI